MGLYSPLESSELKLIEALLNLHFCTTIHFWEFSSSSFALGLINTSLIIEEMKKWENPDIYKVVCYVHCRTAFPMSMLPALKTCTRSRHYCLSAMYCALYDYSRLCTPYMDAFPNSCRWYRWSCENELFCASQSWSKAQKTRVRLDKNLYPNLCICMLET